MVRFNFRNTMNFLTMPMSEAGLQFIFAVIVNGLEFARWDPGTFGYPNDLTCQHYTNVSQRSPLEYALKCLRHECVVWTSDFMKTTCVICGRCDGSGLSLPVYDTDVYRSLQVKDEVSSLLKWHGWYQEHVFLTLELHHVEIPICHIKSSHKLIEK